MGPPPSALAADRLKCMQALFYMLAGQVMQGVWGADDEILLMIAGTGGCIVCRLLYMSTKWSFFR